MSKTALLTLNEKTNQWEASYNGEVFLKSSNKQYVIGGIVNQTSNKARTLGVTKYEELGAKSATAEAFVAPKVEFGINERFEFLSDYVDMVASGVAPSAVITGEGGLGKTHTVMKALKASGLRDIREMEIGASFSGKKGFVVVKGNSTPKGLYRTLFENRNQVVIFDDCDSVLLNDVAANLLKAALDSYDKRIISWNSEGFGDDDLPKSFEFTGGVIFISNLARHKVPQPIRSRANVADVSMTRMEIIDRMSVIVKEDDFLPEFDTGIKTDAINFLREHANDPQVKSLNLRSLINTVKNRAAKPEHWKRLSLYSLYNA